MATAPTFIASYSSSYTGNTSPKTVSVTTQAGDVVVVYSGTDGNYLVSTPSGNSINFVLQMKNKAASTASSYIWTGVDTAGGTSWTLSVTCPGTTDWGFTCVVFRGSDGIGISNRVSSTGAPSLAQITNQDNSAIVVFVADYNASSGARTWRTVNGITPTAGNSQELTYTLNSGSVGFYGAYYSDAGTAGSQTVGLTAPTGQIYDLVTVEVQGHVTPPAGPVWRSRGNVGYTGSATTTINLPKPDGLAVNDIMVAILHLEKATTSSPASSGFTLEQEAASSAGGGPLGMAVLWKRATSGDVAASNFTFTWTGNAYCTGDMHAFSGCTTTGNPFQGSTIATSGGTMTIPSISYTAGTGLGIWACADYLDYFEAIPPTGYTMRTFTGPGDLSLAVRSDTAGSTTTGTATADNTESRTAFAGTLLAPGIALVGTLVDNFNDNIISPTLWTTYANAGSVVEAGQRLVISPDSNNTGYAGIYTPITYDLTASQLMVECVQGLSTTSGNEHNLTLQLDASNLLSIVVLGTNISFRSRVAGSNSDTTITRNDVTMRWWRIRESGGTVYWDTSPDSYTWTNRRSLAAPFAITALTPGLNAGTYTSVASPGAALFDNLNYLPKTSELADNFNDNVTDTTYWVATPDGGTIVESGGQLVITPASSYVGYNYYYAINNFDFTNSQVVVECVQGVNNSTGCEQTCTLSLDTPNKITTLISGNGLVFRLRTGGSNSDVTITRNDVTMRWWRMRESGGTIYWDTSPDGMTWTNRRSAAGTFAEDSLNVSLSAGTWQTVVTPGVGIFDNFNTFGTTDTAWWRA